MKKTAHMNLVLMGLVGWIFLCSCSGGGPAIDSVQLRSDFAELDKATLVAEMQSKHLNCPGDQIKGALKNQFEPVLLQDQKVVNDHSTGLMWQQDEEETRFDWREAEAYVAKMNEEKFAGFDDWRLPTAVELGSLLTAKKKGDNFIDPLFHKELLSTWTTDIVKDAFAGAWFVDFAEGIVADGNRAAGLGHVRLVRSM